MLDVNPWCLPPQGSRGPLRGLHEWVLGLKLHECCLFLHRRLIRGHRLSLCLEILIRLEFFCLYFILYILIVYECRLKFEWAIWGNRRFLGLVLFVKVTYCEFGESPHNIFPLTSFQFNSRKNWNSQSEPHYCCHCRLSCRKRSIIFFWARPFLHFWETKFHESCSDFLSWCPLLFVHIAPEIGCLI